MAEQQITRWQSASLAVGVVGLVLCAAAWFVNPAQFFRSYLVAYLFWTAIALGSLGILMLQHLTGGAWGILSRRLLESACATLPLLALLFIPLFFGMHSLYSWTQPNATAVDPQLLHKQIYLNTPFFLVRWAVYFIVWSGLAYLLNTWSSAQDRTGDPRLALRLQSVSGPGLFVLALTLTFALLDWVMSLQPDWYSTIYGVTFIAGAILAAFAFAIGVLSRIAAFPPLAGILRPKHFHDLGGLLMTFVMLWAYCSFAQFLIIWSGNLREEAPWYLRRLNNGWGWIAAALIVFHFFIPFFLLLSAELKRRPRLLGMVAAVILMMRFVDLSWLVIPAFSPYASRAAVVEAVALSALSLVALGGIWLWMFVRRLSALPLLPLNDPFMREAFSDEEG